MGVGAGVTSLEQMVQSARSHVRRAATSPRWALSALNTLAQWQRLLRWEPPAFRALARHHLCNGRIEGWRFRQDLALLYLLARDVPDPGVTVEIGSYKGLGTAALAYGALHGGRDRVHTVDPHTGDRQVLEGDDRGAPSSAAELARNLSEAGVAHHVLAHTMTSDELAGCWDGQRIRVLFIDGWHSYDAVLSDIHHWVPLLTPDGVVVIDDYANYPDVRAGVEASCDILPQRQRRAGCMWLAHQGQLPPAVQRHLRIPWGWAAGAQ